MKKFVQLIFSLLFCCVYVLTGQPRSIWLSKNINNEDGLSNSAVTRIFMDSKAVVWIGTWDGLNMYNGTDIRVFKPDIFNNSSISNNIIRDFLEDYQGNIWVLTDEGINRLDLDNMSFRSYFSNLKNLPVQEHNMKACFGPDSSIYITLYGFGPAFYNSQQDTFIKLDLPGLSIKDEKKLLDWMVDPVKIFTCSLKMDCSTPTIKKMSIILFTQKI